MSSLLFSTTRIVDINGSTSFTSIQVAIDQSAWGDTIIVYPGIYHENLILNDKQLYLRSLFYVSNDSSYIDNTVINGSQSGPCFKIMNGHNLTIEGFKITNGYSDYVDLESGGINIMASNVQLRFNKITKNKTKTSGGGIFIKNANLDLVGNNIYDNTAYSGGGGIYAAFAVNIFFSN